MRIGFQVVLFILILNLTTGLMYQTSVPGTAYSNVLTGTPSSENITERFNASSLINPEPSMTITFVGHLLAALNAMWMAIRMVVVGFPDMLAQIAGSIPDPSARATFTSISYVLYGVFSIIIFMWVFQLVTGRQVED